MKKNIKSHLKINRLFFINTNMLSKVFCLLLVLSFFPTISLCVYADDYSNHWSSATIKQAISHKILTGDESGNINPDTPITRSELITMVVRDLKLNKGVYPTSFFDVDRSDWFYDYIACAEYNKFIIGVGDSYFHPNSPITREDAITILGRAYKINSDAGFNISEFHDGIYIHDYALGYMSYMSDNGILKGYDDKTIRPLSSITRAEALTIIYRLKNPEPKPTTTSLESEKLTFARGYPSISSSGLANGITVSFKTNMPCSIYYKLTDASFVGSSLVPSPSQITTYLTEIDSANKEQTYFISADVLKTYNIYFVAKTDDGLTSKVTWLNDVRPLAYYEGDGSENNPYTIYTEQQLSHITFHPDKCFILQNDIQLSNNWTPIASADSQDKMFSGILDGNGHKISNLSIKSSNNFVGLFSYINGGTVKNLYVEANNIEGKNDVGIIAGENNGNILNCFVSGNVTSTRNNVGGIVGTNNGTIKNCASAAFTIQSGTYAGGIVGVNTGNIFNCASYSYSILSDMNSGGISAANIGGTIENCLSASMNIASLITVNSGKISANRLDGKTINNYSYDKINAIVGDGYSDTNSQNGLDISWDTMTDKSFYFNTLNWDTDIWSMADKDDLFLMPSLITLSKPSLISGITIYAPQRISTEDELIAINENLNNHYILTNDIALTKKWIPIAGDNLFIENYEQGFTGSLDGNGYSIHNLNMEFDENRNLYGLFGVNSGGTIKDLNISGINIDGSESVGGIAAINYGYIFNSILAGNITAHETTDTLSIGSVSAFNYGHIDNIVSKVDLSAEANAATIGGISAQNEGFINNSAFINNIKFSENGKHSNSTVGGIVGFNADGYIYNVYDQSNIDIISETAYAGGIVGMQNGGEIYKASSKGNIFITSKKNLNDTSYIGGIAGLSSSGLIMHSFSNTALTTQTETSYMGGISGYNLACNIQNTYTTNTLLQIGTIDCYAGGIVGINEDGFIVDSVAINPSIRTTGAASRVCSLSSGGNLSNNYGLKNMLINYEELQSTDDCTSVTLNEIRDINFFFLPVHENGILGWSSTKYDEKSGVWSRYTASNIFYPFPLLNEVKYQDTFNSPSY